MVKHKGDLLPCPFCGEEAELAEYKGKETSRWYVGCTNEKCGAELELTGGFATRIQAEKSWNSRHDLRITAVIGKWEDNFDNIRQFKCSRCGSIHAVASQYCPDCGAKMEL